MIHYPMLYSKYQELTLYLVKLIKNHGGQLRLIRLSKRIAQAWILTNLMFQSLKLLFKTKNINTMQTIIIF